MQHQSCNIYSSLNETKHSNDFSFFPSITLKIKHDSTILQSHSTRQELTEGLTEDVTQH